MAVLRGATIGFFLSASRMQQQTSYGELQKRLEASSNPLMAEQLSD